MTDMFAGDIVTEVDLQRFERKIPRGEDGAKYWIQEAEPKLITALREAWRERDSLQHELNADETWYDMMKQRDIAKAEVARLTDALAGTIQQVENHRKRAEWVEAEVEWLKEVLAAQIRGTGAIKKSMLSHEDRLFEELQVWKTTAEALMDEQNNLCYAFDAMKEKDA